MKKEISKEFEVKKTLWREYRSSLDLQKIDTEKTADKTIFFLSTGTIGLSLTILDKFFVSNKCFYFILIIGWLCLMASIIIQAISYFFASKRLAITIDKVDEVLESYDNDSFIESEKNVHKDVESSNVIISSGTKLAFYLMILGICLVLLFTIVVITNKNQKDDKNTENNNSKFKYECMSNNKNNKPAPEKVNNQTRLTEQKQTFSQAGSGESKTQENKQAVQIVKPPSTSKPKEDK